MNQSDISESAERANALLQAGWELGLDLLQRINEGAPDLSEELRSLAPIQKLPKRGRVFDFLAGLPLETTKTLLFNNPDMFQLEARRLAYLLNEESDLEILTRRFEGVHRIFEDCKTSEDPQSIQLFERFVALLRHFEPQEEAFEEMFRTLLLKYVW